MDESENNTVNDSEKSSNTTSNKNMSFLLAGILVLAVVAGAYHFMKGKEDLPPTLPPAPPSIEDYSAPGLDESGSTTADAVPSDTQGAI